MVHEVRCLVRRGERGLAGAPVRYDLLRRLRQVTGCRGVAVLAFGLGADEVRLVLEGDPKRVGRAVRGLKVGTSRRARDTWGFELAWHDNEWSRVGRGDLEAAVARAHSAPVEAGVPSPLGSPWSSHRDLMLFRVAPFYDAEVLARRVDPRVVHRLAGGRPLPAGWPPGGAAREPLVLLLRVAGSVLGALPSHRSCFRLFAHLARSRGWRRPDIEAALCLGERRVRQLLAAPEPQLGTALVALGDPRLRRVP